MEQKFFEEPASKKENFDRRTQEGRYNVTVNNVVRFFYPEKMNVKLTNDQLPDNLKDEFFMPDGGYVTAEEDFGDDNRVEVLRVRVYNSDESVNDIREYYVKKGGSIDEYIKSQKK
jgi:hypothetical protein